MTLNGKGQEGSFKLLIIMLVPTIGWKLQHDIFMSCKIALLIYYVNVYGCITYLMSTYSMYLLSTYLLNLISCVIAVLQFL